MARAAALLACTTFVMGEGPNVVVNGGMNEAYPDSLSCAAR